MVLENLGGAPSSPIEGQIYYNTNDQVSYIWNGSQWLDMLSGNPAPTPNSAPLSALQIRRANNFTLAALNTWYDIDFETTDISSNSGAIALNDTNLDNVDIKEDGLYRITYHMDSNNLGVTHELYSRIRVNDTAILSGSLLVNRDYQNEHIPSSASFLAWLTVGDFITLQAQRTTANEVINETTLTVVKLEAGVKGDRGEKGDKGDSGEPGEPGGFTNLFFGYDSTGGQAVRQTPITLNIDNIVVNDSYYSISNDEITILADGLYEVSVNAAIEVTDIFGGLRSDIELSLQEDTGAGFVTIPYGIGAGNYIRETVDRSSVSTSFLRYFNTNDKVRVRMRQVSYETNINTLQNASNITIDFIR